MSFSSAVRNFQVSSKLLSLASPVFKALFSPGFAEGQPTSSNPIRIQLHDDDADSMCLMCAVFHHKCAWANGIGLEILKRLVIITDKYDVCMSSKNVCPDRSVQFVMLGFGIETLFGPSSVLMKELNAKMDTC